VNSVEDNVGILYDEHHVRIWIFCRLCSHSRVFSRFARFSHFHLVRSDLRLPWNSVTFRRSWAIFRHLVYLHASSRCQTWANVFRPAKPLSRPMILPAMTFSRPSSVRTAHDSILMSLPGVSSFRTISLNRVKALWRHECALLHCVRAWNEKLWRICVSASSVYRELIFCSVLCVRD